MSFERFGKKQTLTALGAAVFLFIWASWVGLRNDHIYFMVVLFGAYFATETSRKVLLSLMFFVAYLMIYDSLRLYPNYMFNPVHVAEPYNFEKLLFGFEYMGEIVTPNEFFEVNTHPIADVLSGLFYLCWLPVPIGFAIWLYFRDKRMLLDLSLAFLLTNLFGFVLYYAYPAAAPWYVELHGFEENFTIPGNEAGLANFDRIMGYPLFNGMYAKNANVFAAIPSLHSAYPVLPFYFAVKKRLKLASWVFFIICVGIWFAAVYSRHHYIIDVILGIACAGATIFVFERFILKTRVNGWLERYAEVIK